ncbi:MAG: glutamate 5-kinase [Chloroflexota bacterium]|nr:glutamate 5-kinase [Chloroflexota bacterium]
MRVSNNKANEYSSKIQKKDVYHRIVVKVGTNLLTAGTDHLDLEVMSKLVGQIARLHHRGVQVVLVSSGAMAAGRHTLGLARVRRKGRRDIPFKQVLASVGQHRLMYAYEQLFAWQDIVVAQALLTKTDLSDRSGYLNARDTLLALLELKVLPIVNENDVVAVEEIKENKFGDNDNLSALVANLVDADLLALLGDVAGLYTADPHLDPKAKLITRVDRIDCRIEKLAIGSAGQRGIGGMTTKLEAARLATDSGIAVTIANGQEHEVITRLVGGEEIGTSFAPMGSRFESRKRWMLSGLGCKGKVVIDDGAAEAIRKDKCSLLSAGINEVEGEFYRGDVVVMVDAQGHCVARGITSYGSEELLIIKGAHSEQINSILGYEYGAEVVHRNNMVAL